MANRLRLTYSCAVIIVSLSLLCFYNSYFISLFQVDSFLLDDQLPRVVSKRLIHRPLFLIYFNVTTLCVRPAYDSMYLIKRNVENLSTSAECAAKGFAVLLVRRRSDIQIGRRRRGKNGNFSKTCKCLQEANKFVNAALCALVIKRKQQCFYFSCFFRSKICSLSRCVPDIRDFISTIAKSRAFLQHLDVVFFLLLLSSYNIYAHTCDFAVVQFDSDFIILLRLLSARKPCTQGEKLQFLLIFPYFSDTESHHCHMCVYFAQPSTAMMVPLTMLYIFRR